MELIDGVTLAAWLEERPRSWREIVSVFLQAGRGLAAAHAVGVVHRDFKPTNALIGRDGRVRVLDFGLAHSSATGDTEPRAGAAAASPPAIDGYVSTQKLAGTPTYMSPEQFLGLPADAKSDQFSFCVALYRALFGQRPFAGDDLETLAPEVIGGRLRPPPKDSRVPAWVRESVLRGLAVDGNQRWPSMEGLLAALARDPAGARRRWILGSAAAVVVALAALGYGDLHRREALVCHGAARKLAGVWDDARRSTVHAAFAATQKPYAENAFRRVSQALDGYTGAWAAMHDDACEATRVRREQSEELLDLRMECLATRRQEIAADVDLLAAADDNVVQNAVQMTSSLPSLAACADVAALRAQVRPPDDRATRDKVEQVRQRLARARALGQVLEINDALPIARAALTDARALRYRPLEAEALLELGSLESYQSSTAAEKDLKDAALAAQAGRALAVEVGAWTELVALSRVEARYGEAHWWGRLASATLDALGGEHPELQAQLLTNVGGVFTQEAKFDDAVADLKRALAIREKLFGPEHLAVAESLNSLGEALTQESRSDAAVPYLRRALAIREKALGPEHPLFGQALYNFAATRLEQGDYDESLADFRRTLAIYEKGMGPNHSSVGPPLNAIGQILRLRGRYDEALAEHRRALAVAEKAWGPKHPDVAFALDFMGDVFRDQKKYSEALAHYSRALAIWQAALGPQDQVVAVALTGIGRTEIERHRPAAALAPLTRALAIREAHPSDPTWVPETRFALARALWDTAQDRPRARALAAQARSGYAAVGLAGKADLMDVDAWIAKHR
jgi:tetratricopeptide (TPR) repeat protein